jgi:hypothetical protein
MSLSQTSFVVVCVAAPLLLTGCLESQPDYTPFGDGMKAIGICIVVYGIVQALAGLVKTENPDSKNQPSRKGRRSRDDDQPERK